MTYAVPGPISTIIDSSTSVGGIDSPFTRSRAVLDMMKGWEIMKEEMLKGKTFMEAHKIAMRKKGK